MEQRLTAFKLKDNVDNTLVEYINTEPKYIEAVLSTLPEQDRHEAIHVNNEKKKSIRDLAKTNPEVLAIISTLLPEDNYYKIYSTALEVIITHSLYKSETSLLSLFFNTDLISDRAKELINNLKLCESEEELKKTLISFLQEGRLSPTKLEQELFDALIPSAKLNGYNEKLVALANQWNIEINPEKSLQY